MKVDIELIKSILSKYEITKFKNDRELSRWLSQLNETQYNNLLKLTINPEELDFDHNLLLDSNLLNYKDYEYRVLGMSKIKGGKKIPHLYKRLCSQSFLSSKNYFIDLVLLAKTKYLSHCLWLLTNDEFLRNAEHSDDLNIIVRAKDEITSKALCDLAVNKSSLKSNHHRKDMETVSKCDSKLLQASNQKPKSSVNNLAMNKISLEDEHHQENMKLLTEDKPSREYLYLLMTDKQVVNGQNYRREISRLSKAKTKAKARAIYYYITNPQNPTQFDYFDKMRDQEVNIDYTTFDRTQCIKGSQNERYNFYLKLLNEIDDSYVMYFSYLLSNKHLYITGRLDQDIKFLLKVTNKEIFIDLFELMQNEQSLISLYHEQDVLIISRTEESKKRKLLLRIATNQNNLSSINHQYDMLFVSSLNLEELSEEKLNKLYYYLFTSKGANHINHISILENLLEEKEEKQIPSIFRRLFKLNSI